MDLVAGTVGRNNRTRVENHLALIIVKDDMEVIVRWREQKGPGSGALYDLGSHLIDQALHLFGMPNSVTAQVTAQRANAETDDYFHVAFEPWIW